MSKEGEQRDLPASDRNKGTAVVVRELEEEEEVA